MRETPPQRYWKVRNGPPGEAENRSHNPKVAGSNPAPATIENAGQARSVWIGPLACPGRLLTNGSSNGLLVVDVASLADDSATSTSPADEEIHNARRALRRLVQQESQRHPLVIALVAALGTSLEPVQEGLRASLQRFGYRVELVQLSELLDDSPHQPWAVPLPTRGERDYYERRMDAGDELRAAVGDGSALAALAIARVVDLRAKESEPTAFLLRSLKHPEEAALLRHVYGDAFSLIAVAGSVEERRENPSEKLSLFEHPVAKALPETDIARVQRWVDARNAEIGEHIDEMRVEMDVDARAVTILECRPPWREDFGPEWTCQEISRRRIRL